MYEVRFHGRGGQVSVFDGAKASCRALINSARPVAVLLDATIVRAVLLPATMTVLGRRNWYLPRWLNWLPEISGSTPSLRPKQPPARPVIAARP